MPAMIYAPKGRAMEFAETAPGKGDGLALNLYTGCKHGCTYCFNRKTQWYNEEKFNNPDTRKDLLNAVIHDCVRMQGDARPVLLCFYCDPYQFTAEDPRDFTRQILVTLEHYRMTANILTKGGRRAVRDFDLLKRNGWKFGTTLVFTDEAWRERFEPHAAGIQDRIRAIRRAHSQGIQTWLSLEPVIDPIQALKIIKHLKGEVDFWKVGKINHDKVLEDAVDWPKFLFDVRQALAGEKYLIKKDLLAYGGGDN